MSEQQEPEEEREYQVRPGEPFPLGAIWDGQGTNFSIFSEHAERVCLCLFDEERGETRLFSLLRKRDFLRRNDKGSLTDAEQNELTKLEKRLCDNVFIRSCIENGFY